MLGTNIVKVFSTQFTEFSVKTIVIRNNVLESYLQHNVEIMLLHEHHANLVHWLLMSMKRWLTDEMVVNFIFKKQNEKEDATVTDYTIAIIAQSSIDHVEHTIAFHSKLQ